MKLKKYIVLLSGFFFLVILSNAVSFDTKEKNCAILLNTRCDTCHYRARICQALGEKSKREWERTVKTMVRYGVKLTKAQQKILASCLYEAPKKTKFVCVQPEPEKESK
jgi:hypothetical protein